MKRNNIATITLISTVAAWQVGCAESTDPQGATPIPGSVETVAPSEYAGGDVADQAETALNSSGLQPEFSTIDRDGNAIIIASEWASMGDRMPAFSQADLDGDGTITREEYLSAMSDSARR